MKIIQIYPDWDKRVRILAEKFNRYVSHHSVNMTTSTVEKLIDLLESDPVTRFETAQVLSLIEQANPEIITNHTSERVQEVLWADNPTGDGKYVETVEEVEVPTIMREDQPFSSFDMGFATDSNVYVKQEDSVERWPFKNEIFEETDEEWDAFQEETKSTPEPSRPKEEDQWIQVNFSATQVSYEEYDPEKDGSQGNPAQEDTPEMLLAKPIEALGLINVKKTKYDPGSMKGRKCAMGDGELEGFEGQLWECMECHTIYHESCLKVQALFDGICKICDAPFLKNKK